MQREYSVVLLDNKETKNKKLHINLLDLQKEHWKDKPGNKEVGYLQGVGGEMEQKEYSRELYFSEHAFLISFDFGDHVNVLHTQKIKSVRMG